MMARRVLPGNLLVVEGPNGVGKTTICELLAKSLTDSGCKVLSLSFPGKQQGTIGDLVYRIHHDEGPVRVRGISTLALQALHIAAHIDAIDQQIVPALEKGATVLLDRFWWSAWVYGLVQGCGRRKLKALIEAERSAWGTVLPTLAVLLRRPSPLGDNNHPPKWRSLAAEYGRLLARERRKYPVAIVDNVTEPLAAAEIVLSELNTRLKKTGSRLVVSEFKRHSECPTMVSHILPLKPTVVYDSYWRFAAERQEIFFRRLEGMEKPWTEDPVLTEYKFTNAYRASDRVSQYLIRHVLYREDLPNSAEEIFFRILLFKVFNKIETWEALETSLGPIAWETYSFRSYDQVLTRALDTGEKIYSGAYIMPPGGKLGHRRKHRNHLVLLEQMMADSAPARLCDCRSMQQAFELLKSYPGIGDFLAYQYVTDLNYSELTDYSESDFVVPGPGARDGIRKCFVDQGGLNEPETIKFVTDEQEREFERLGISFRTLWGRPLKLIDCQNLFCEVDKYARVKHPDIEGVSGRSRIKQRLDPKPSLPEPWYPPKWNLNRAIDEWREPPPR